MELTPAQIDFIRQDIHERGITMEGLVDSLIDHICCAIENDVKQDFAEAYEAALSSFGENGLKRIEEETLLLLTIKKKIIMKRTMFVLGYIAAFLSTTGLLFKLQHWPGAAVMLTLGIALLNFGFLPMYFMDRYKRSVKST